MRRPSLTILAIASLIVAGCGDSDQAPLVVPPHLATIADLTAPWQMQPLLLDPDMHARIETACGREMDIRGRKAVLIDVRGAGVAIARMDGGSCDALAIQPDGQIVNVGAGWWAKDPEGLARLEGARFGALEKQAVVGAGLPTVGWSVRGRYGAMITSIVIAPANHPLIIATLDDGWFGAWWPNKPGEVAPDGSRPPPFFVRGYDDAGTLLDQVGP